MSDGIWEERLKSRGECPIKTQGITRILKIYTTPTNEIRVRCLSEDKNFREPEKYEMKDIRNYLEKSNSNKYLFCDEIPE